MRQCDGDGNSRDGNRLTGILSDTRISHQRSGVTVTTQSRLNGAINNIVSIELL